MSDGECVVFCRKDRQKASKTTSRKVATDRATLLFLTALAGTRAIRRRTEMARQDKNHGIFVGFRAHESDRIDQTLPGIWRFLGGSIVVMTELFDTFPRP